MPMPPRFAVNKTSGAKSPTTTHTSSSSSSSESASGSGSSESSDSSVSESSSEEGGSPKHKKQRLLSPDKLVKKGTLKVCIINRNLILIYIIYFNLCLVSFLKLIQKSQIKLNLKKKMAASHNVPVKKGYISKNSNLLLITKSKIIKYFLFLQKNLLFRERRDHWNLIMMRPKVLLLPE